MDNYTFHKRFKEVYDKAVEHYAKGGRNVNTFFTGADTEILRSVGTNPMEIYDFAEDFNQDGEPDWETAFLIQYVRKQYFFEVQDGQFSTETLDENTLPAKSDAVRDIEWLPRIIEKAKAKLKGELPTSLMYCCGGDRAFLKKHDIHPADFLRLVWRYEDDDSAVVDWVVKHSKVNQKITG